MARARKKIGLWTAIIFLFVAIAGCIDRYISWEIARYQAPAKELEKQADAIADQVISKLRASGVKFDTRTVFDVESRGRDIYMEAGYELPKDSTSPSAEMDTTVHDYPVGKYLLEEALNPKIIISAVGESVTNFLQQNPGSLAAQVEVVGSADGIPVLGGVLYRGDLGKFLDFLYYSEDRHRVEKMTLVPGITKLSNDSIAFLRAYSALIYLSSIPTLAPASQRISTTTTRKQGGAYRKIIARVTIKNGLAERYSELSWSARIFVDRQINGKGKK